MIYIDISIIATKFPSFQIQTIDVQLLNDMKQGVFAPSSISSSFKGLEKTFLMTPHMLYFVDYKDKDEDISIILSTCLQRHL